MVSTTTRISKNRCGQQTDDHHSNQQHRNDALKKRSFFSHISHSFHDLQNCKTIWDLPCRTTDSDA